MEMVHKSGCSFADPVCSHSYPTCFHSFIFSPHPALISVHLARVYTCLTVWDGSTAFSHQLCHGVHVVQNSVVPFCSPVMLCSTLHYIRVECGFTPVKYILCSAVCSTVCVFTPAPPWDPHFPYSSPTSHHS